MSRWRKPVILLACGVVAVVLFVLVRPDGEPSYKGRSLSEWIMLKGRAHNSGIPFEPAEFDAAISAIGANAVPYLVEWMQRPVAITQPGTVGGINDVSGMMFGRALIHRNRDECARLAGTVAAFKVLGPRADSAMAELFRIAADTSFIRNPTFAAQCLGCFGERSLPPLLSMLTNNDVRARCNAAGAFGDMGSNAIPAIPALIGRLGDTNNDVVYSSELSLGRLRLEPDRVVPALSSNLRHSFSRVRYRAAWALAQYGTNARSAIPALTNLLNDPEEKVRAEASNALVRIAPDLFPSPERDLLGVVTNTPAE